jgi:rubredoxin-NAD+ reductase
VAAGNCDAGVRLTLDDGSQFEAEVVLSAIGLRPRTALAAAAGLATNRGIVVNGWLQTNDDAIHAIGDCAEVDGQVLPFVMPLLQQIKALASTLTGQPTPVVYPVMPVNLKTPAHPLVMVTPAKGINGGWQVERVAGGMRAIYVDEREQLAGFALSGDQTSQRVELAQKVAPWLA